MEEEDKSSGLPESHETTEADAITSVNTGADLREGSGTVETPHPGPGPGSTPYFIENYRVIQKIAEGGMGEVFEAEQLRPVRRRVAVKVIKLGMDTRRFVRRFESERQALALMDHSHIAKIFDAGATQQGRPYFSMEFVHGIPITQYCDRQKLNITERLRLFLAVCEGVSHAHQKGIIHRDIKPSNILVASEGQKVVPKIIDFGLAKALGQNLTESTTFTQFGQAMGTPAYMSPEQIMMDASGVDTRTDIYALGILLYELLVGRLPFDFTQIPNATVDEIIRKICDEEPVRPSSRFKAGTAPSTEAAEKRRIEPGALMRQLRGDLDWITLKALEKDRNRRYGSVSELAADIERHLAHQPVLASPPSTFYRMGKFLRRHQVGAGIAALAILALLSGATFATVGFVRASRAEEAARREAETANQVTEFLIGLYGVSDPSEARGNTVTARELLDNGAERIRTALKDQPFVRTRLLYQMGRVYQALGLYPKARELMELSLKSAGQDERFSTGAIKLELGRLSRNQGRTQEAFELAQEAVALSEKFHGKDHPETAESLGLLGEIHRDKGEYEEADRLFQRALAITEAAFGPQDTRVARTLWQLGWLYQLRAEYKAALPVYERALAIAERNLAEGDPVLGYFLNDFAVLHRRLGDQVKSEELHRRALAVREKALSPNHPAVAETLGNLGTALWDQARYEEARPYLERALMIRQQAFGSEHPMVASSLNNLALLSRAMGDFKSSRDFYEQALRIHEKVSGPGHRETADILRNLGNLLARISDYAGAQPTLERALNIYEEALGPDHTEVADTLLQISLLNSRRGNHAQAIPPLQRALQIKEKTLGPDHIEVASILNGLGELRQSIDDIERAARIYEQANNDNYASVLWTLVWLQEKKGDLKAAAELSRRATGIVRAAYGNEAAQEIYNAARVDAIWGRPELAVYRLRQAIKLGFSNPAIMSDDAFDNLRAKPEFQAVVAEIKARK